MFVVLTFVRARFVIVADAVRSSEEETTPVPEIENLEEELTWKFTKSPRKEEVTFMPMYVPEGFPLPKVEEPIWIYAVLEDSGGKPESERAVTPVPVSPRVDPVAFVNVRVPTAEAPETLREAPAMLPEAVRLVEETFVMKPDAPWT